MSAGRKPSRRAGPTDPLWQGGFLVGAAIGAAATVLGRRAERSARRGLVDWPAAEAFAIDRLRGARGALPPSELKAAEAAYASALGVIVPKLSEVLGSELPGIVERAGVVDRAGRPLRSSPHIDARPRGMANANVAPGPSFLTAQMRP